MDLKCFLGTIGSVLMHDGVVEGGTGELNKAEEETEAHKSETAQGSAKKETIAKDTEEREKVVVLRPPMIYGKGSKGNYPQLAKLAGKLPVFPIVHNQRSMLYIENLAQFVKRMIAMVKGHRLVMVPATGWIIRLMKKIPGKIGTLTGKAFGDSVYDMQMSEYKEEYRVCDWKESVRRTEG